MRLVNRFARSFLALILLTLAIVALVNLMTTRSYLTSQGGRDLAARAGLAADNLTPPLLAGEHGSSLERRVARLGRLAQARVTVIAPDGTVLADSEADAADLPNHGDRPEVQQALRSGRGQASGWSTTGRTSLLYAARLIRRDGAAPTAIVRVAIPLTSRDYLVRRLTTNTLLVALLAALLSGATAYLLTRSLANPVAEMSRVAKRMAAGNLEARVYPGFPGELGELAESLNLLAREFTSMLASTERERREVAAVLESLSDVVIATDARGRVALFNAAAERAFHVPASAALGQPVLAAARLAGLAEGFSAVLAGGAPESREITTVTPEEHTFEALLSPVRRPDGSVSGAVAVLHDLTEVRRLERVRSEFVANVSHELRTPLTSLAGFVETLEDGAADDPVTRRRFLGIISAETARLGRLVEDLLDLSRLESGHLELHTAPVDLRDLAGRVLDFYRPTAEAKGVALQDDLPAALPPVPGDADLLEQVVRNLVDNAVKYTPVNGRVSVSATPVEYSDGRREVVLRVSDTGPGIPPEHLPRLFERFYRVDRARSRALGGTGLGLAIVKHIVERHAGRAWVESEPGQGATFSVALPL